MRAALAAGLLLLATACGAAGGGLGGSTAAVVNGEEISMGLLEEVVGNQLEAAGSPQGTDRTTAVEQGQRQALSLLIQATIVRQAAAERDISVTDEEIQAAFDQQAAFQEGGAEELTQRVSQIGFTDELAHDVLFRSIALQGKLEEAAGADIEISEEELRATYEQRREQYVDVPAVRHILVDSEAEAREIIELLESGEAEFAELAQQRSTDSGSADLGGDLGAAPASRYVEPFAEAVREAEVGQVVGPVETQFGFHVIEVTQRETRSFEEVRDSLREELVNQRRQGVLQELATTLFTEAEVEVNSRLGRWDAQNASVVAGDPLVPSSQSTGGAVPPGQIAPPGGGQQAPPGQGQQAPPGQGQQQPPPSPAATPGS